MAPLSILVAIVVMASNAYAHSRSCINLTIPVHLSSRNGIFNVPTPQTDIDVTNFMLEYSQQGHNLTAERLMGYRTVSGSYHIAAEFCMPREDYGKEPTVQVLTHGIGFDRR